MLVGRNGFLVGKGGRGVHVNNLGLEPVPAKQTLRR
jgi:hypothetical protein